LKIIFSKIIILPVVLYACATWTFAISEERRLRLFENRILRRIFVPKSSDNLEWRRIHNGQLHIVLADHDDAAEIGRRDTP
jgi:hypothetical protein